MPDLKTDKSISSPRSSKYNPWGTRGSKLDLGHPKTELDWVIYHSKKIPGPGAYGAPKLPGMQLHGGAISQAKVKSEIDWIELHSKKFPGPADYSPRLPVAFKDNCRFSPNVTPRCGRSELEWTIHVAKQLPGPGNYSPDVTSIAVRAGIVVPGADFPIKTYAMRLAEKKAEEVAQDPERRKAAAAAAAAAAASGEGGADTARETRERSMSIQPARKALRSGKRRTDDWRLHAAPRRGIFQDGPQDLEDFDLSVAVDRMR
jgi:hypothetical protein